MLQSPLSAPFPFSGSFLLSSFTHAAALRCSRLLWQSLNFLSSCVIEVLTFASSYPLDQVCLFPTTSCRLHFGRKFLSSSHPYCSFVAVGHSLSKLAAASLRSHLCHRELSSATNHEILQHSLHICSIQLGLRPQNTSTGSLLQLK